MWSCKTYAGGGMAIVLETPKRSLTSTRLLEIIISRLDRIMLNVGWRWAGVWSSRTCIMDFTWDELPTEMGCNWIIFLG